MRSSPRHRLLPLALLGLLVLPACEEMQEPEPLSKTVPVALLILGVALAVGVFLLRPVVRRAARHPAEEGAAPALHYPRITAALIMAPVAIVGAAILWAGVWDVGVGYRRPHMSMWSWDGAAELWTMLLGVIAVALAISTVTALAVLSRHRRARYSGIVVLLAAVVGLSFAGGMGLAWLPGLLAGFVQRPDARRNSNHTWVRSSSVGGADSTSSPSTSSKATRDVIVHSVSANASRA